MMMTENNIEDTSHYFFLIKKLLTYFDTGPIANLNDSSLTSSEYVQRPTSNAQLLKIYLVEHFSQRISFVLFCIYNVLSVRQGE
jgi:hypothetical protein